MTSDLEQFLKDHPPQPFKGPVVSVDYENDLLEVALEDVPHYVDWIKKERADTGIWRAMDDDRVVGATLPYRSKEKLRLIE